MRVPSTAQIPLPPGVTTFAFFCDMSAFDAMQRRRYKELRDWLLDVATVSRVDDGYRFVFAPGAEPLQRVAEFISLERRCCPFLQFRLVVAPAAAATLELAGPDGVHDFLRAELGFAEPSQRREEASASDRPPIFSMAKSTNARSLGEP